nr:hypothetical protein [Tanacetum cinerariifolium]
DFVKKWLRWAQTALGYEGLRHVNALQPTAELRPLADKQTDERDLMPYVLLNRIERLAFYDRLAPAAVLAQLVAEEPNYEFEQLRTYVKRFYQLWSRNQWKRERYAPSFHLDDYNVDPRSWLRFPILSGGFGEELAGLTLLNKRTKQRKFLEVLEPKPILLLPILLEPPPCPRVSATADVALLAQLQQGSEAAFRTLVERYQDRIYKTAFSLLRSSEEAEDVTQEFAGLQQPSTARTARPAAPIGAIRRRAAVASTSCRHWPLACPAASSIHPASRAGAQLRGNSGLVGPDADEEWEKLLHQLRAQPTPPLRPFFYARVQAKLAATQRAQTTWLLGWVRRPVYVALLSALVLAVSGDGAALRPTPAASQYDNYSASRPAPLPR